ncbi:MAG TPA: UDP-N-acetylmuramate--L-alanine ligase [Tepidisphaeraceae bacterium]|jgi:UDP-N-acetylmuramate--alanine ligase
MDHALSEMRTDSRGGNARPASETDRPASRFAGKRIHFIGIGGSGMSGLARMLLDSGAIVSGSEPKPNAQTLELAKRGVKISRDQLGELLSRDVDMVVRTAAVKDNNPEFQAANQYGLKSVKYAQMLGMVMGERHGVAIAGTHGKSTTTAMTAYALLKCGADPSFVVGGTVPQLGGGSHSGKGKAFIAEACEFDRSFHNLRPKVAVITNVEADHLDCYKDLVEIIESFRTFAKLVPADGLVLVNGADAKARQAVSGVPATVKTVAVNTEADWSGVVTGIENGCYRGEIRQNGKIVGRLELSVAGLHNFFDATMAIAACAACGADPAKTAEALSEFRGVDRRMTEVGRYRGATIVDDYGHHPTEIRTTLRALRERYSPKRLWCVFQPHQHSRTRHLLDEFATAFVDADRTLIPDIYFVRDSEAERQRVTAADLVERVNRNGQHALHLPTFDQILQHLRAELRPGDLMVTMGAGNIWEIGRDLVAENTE